MSQFRQANAIVCPFCRVQGREMLSETRDYHVKGLDCPDFSVGYCESCRIGFSLPQLAHEELAEYYPREYEAYIPKKGVHGWMQALKYRMDLATVAGELKGKEASLFEIGAGRGEFLSAAQRRGFRVTGAEPSVSGREAAQKHYGIRLLGGYAEDLTFPERFDVVVARHVLEHMSDPKGVLGKIFQTGLKPGGVLLLKLPTFDSWEARLFGKFWCGWDLPRHRFHFTPRGITGLLLALGFADVEVRRELVPIDSVRSLLFLKKYGKSRLGRFFGALVFSMPDGGRLLAGLLSALLMAPLGPGRMIITARRP